MKLSLVFSVAVLALLFPTFLRADEPALPLVAEEDFEKDADRWQPTDSAAWKLVERTGGGQVFAQVAASKYEPPHRSPFNFALLKDVNLADFQLDVEVRSTCKDYGHRDVCPVFGYQDPAHFYYVHLGKQADDHANQVFIVNDAPRTKISTKTTPGTPWDDAWHHVRIVRSVADGAISVYFDDLNEPAMTAVDTTFGHGQIGIGTFDDTAEFDNVSVHGELK